MTKITACPSPRGSNNERLFLFHAPRGVAPPLALDQALRRRADDRHDRRHGRDADLGEHDAEFYRKLENLLQYHVPEDHLGAAISDLNEICGGKVYGDRRFGDHHEADDETEEEPDRERDRERMREVLERKGIDESIISDVLEAMPHSAVERGFGGRLHREEADDHRRADDRRHRRGARDLRMAADSSGEPDSFARMFPGAARIGLGAL
jgi:hypothetical protein